MVSPGSDMLTGTVVFEQAPDLWIGHKSCRAAGGNVFMSHNRSVPSARTFFSFLVVSLILGGTSSLALAADHLVSASTPYLNCSSIRPGDTVTLAAGKRGVLNIDNCTGTASSPIVIRNDRNGSGPTIIRRTIQSNGGFVFSCRNCVHVVIDGSGKWVGAPSGKTYGIKVTTEASGDSPATFLMMTGTSSDFTIRYVEIDGQWPSVSTNGIGIQVNDHTIFGSANPGKWRENLLIENTYVHDVEGEGLYVGPNIPNDGLPLRNVRIRDNIVDRTGWDCIQAKNMRSGTNAIHHNKVTNCGIAQDGAAGQHFGISCYESTGCQLYNNWVQRTGEVGINCLIQQLPSSAGSQTCEIYNNVVLDTGVTGPTIGSGIAVTTRQGSAVFRAAVFNNTVVGTEGHCFLADAQTQSGRIQNNIAADCGMSGVSAPTQLSNFNNLSGTSRSIGFVNVGAADYRLLASSPAVDSVLNGFPSADFAGLRRPQGNDADQGAYEFAAGQSGIRPNPPAALSAE